MTAGCSASAHTAAETQNEPRKLSTARQGAQREGGLEHGRRAGRLRFLDEVAVVVRVVERVLERLLVRAHGAVSQDEAVRGERVVRFLDHRAERREAERAATRRAG